MHIMLTGAGGMLALDLIQLLSQTTWKLTALSHTELNICDAEQVQKIIAEQKPDILVNCAAYTNVDGAETHEAEAHQVNAKAVGILAQACYKQKVKLIHISTDFVFDGNSQRPYTEQDATSPLGVYGKTKLAGEQEIQKIGGDFLIIRTSWLYGIHGGNFVKTMLRLASNCKEIRVVQDQIGSPTWTYDLAHAIIQLIESKAQGILHFSNQGQCSWYEFAQNIIQFGIELELLDSPTQIIPIPTEEYPTPAQRPYFSVLNTELYQNTTQEIPPSWKDSCKKMMISLSVKNA